MQQIKSIVLLVIGTLPAGWGIEGFLLPNHFVDGGVTGVSMLLAQFFKLPLPFWLALVNLPFIWLGLKHIGKEFAIKGGLAIAALALWLLVIDFQPVTNDQLLGSIFGGIFVGAGVGLAIRGGGVVDGTEILALILSKHTAATVGEIILGVNLAIFLIAGVFIGSEPALYSVLTYFAAGKTIDFLLHGVEAYNGVMIFSAQSVAIRQDILSNLGRGVTILRGVGGYSANEQEVLYCVVTRLELSRLQKIATDIDPSAFIVISPVHDVSGGVVKKRAFH
jgi:uncharacterized membrane-anchored protein YitT (DUF2179 family)